MATRMQQRKGTAAQWTAANPILNAGEIGWESDTNKFKIGDGTNHWADLDYFADINSTANPAFGSSITFEGTTANDFETVFQITDPTADRTITFPDASGTVALAANVAALSGAAFTGAVTGTDLSLTGNLTVLGTTTTIDSSTILLKNSLVFEGATADSFETTIQITEPTADQTITLQNASGVIPLRDTSDTFTNKSISLTTNTITGTKAEFNAAMSDADFATLAGTETLTNKTLTSPVVSGLTLSDGSLVIEGATADAFELTISAGDPTADRTVTFQDVSGTVALTADFAGYVTETGTQTLTNKSISLGSNTVTSTLAQLNTAISDADVATLAGTETLTNKTLTSPVIDGNGIVFEGATADSFETTLQVVDPTADITITLPNATTTLVGTDTTQTLSNKTLSSPTITAGSITVLATVSGLDSDFSSTFAQGEFTDYSLYKDGETFTDFSVNDTVRVRSTINPAINSITWTIVQKNLVGYRPNVKLRAAGVGDALFEDVTDGILEKISGSSVTISSTEISYLDGVTSAIQTQLDAKLPKSGGTMTGAIAMGTSKITGLGTPTDAADAATKAYVDALGEGLHIHASVVAATTANINLATDVENGDTLDGVTLATGNRILVKNQSTASQNGIYVVAASGAPSRAADFDSPAEIDGGDFVFVTGGTVNDNRGFVQINTVGTVGTDAIEFSQFSGAGTFVAGNGLTLTDNSFTINTSITADLSTEQTLTNKTLTSAKINLGINAQTGTTYTFVLADDGKFVTASNANPITVTIPPISSHAYPVGAQLNIVQKGAGQVTFAQGAGVTIRSTGTTASAPKLRVQYSSATAVHEGSDIWYVVGDIS